MIDDVSVGFEEHHLRSVSGEYSDGDEVNSYSGSIEDIVKGDRPDGSIDVSEGANLSFSKDFNSTLAYAVDPLRLRLNVLEIGEELPL